MRSYGGHIKGNERVGFLVNENGKIHIEFYANKKEAESFESSDL